MIQALRFLPEKPLAHCPTIIPERESYPKRVAAFVVKLEHHVVAYPYG